MQELKKVQSGHLGQVVFLAGKVTIKAHLHLEQWSQGSVYRPKIEDPISEDAIACEQALLFGQAKRASQERASEGPFLCPSRLRRSLACSRETRFTRSNRRACSQANDAII